MKTYAQRMREAAKAGYSIDWLVGSPIAQACAAQFGRRIQALPVIKK